MAKLLKEEVQDVTLEILEEGTNSTKNYYLTGIFMQSESVNKNGRVYPRPILEKEVNRYINEKINRHSSLGELGHPDTPSVNLHLASHIITELKWHGNDVIGKAKVMDTPMGKIAKNLIDEGVILGMSSRALGSIKTVQNTNYVQDDLRLATVDIVHEPSAMNAFVNGILENKEWIMVNGIWTEQQSEINRQALIEATTHDLEGIALQLWSNLFKNLKI